MRGEKDEKRLGDNGTVYPVEFKLYHYQVREINFTVFIDITNTGAVKPQEILP
jgi:hypothetical protein